MQKIKKILVFLAVFSVLVLPVFSFSAGLIPCGTTNSPDSSTNHPCDFNDVMTLINKVIKFILFDLAIPISAIMFTYAGFLMVTSGGSTEARGKAKNIFATAVYGILFAAGAWLIIRTLLSILGYNGDWIGFPPITIV